MVHPKFTHFSRTVMSIEALVTFSYNHFQGGKDFHPMPIKSKPRMEQECDTTAFVYMHMSHESF